MANILLDDIYRKRLDCYSPRMIKEYSIKNPTDFDIVVDDILELHKLAKNENLILALEGDLGVGKTTFTQRLAQKLGVEELVTSPTFTIIKQYELNLSTSGFEELVHMDAYRIESEDEVYPLHLERLLQKPNTIICIEWPEKIRNFIPASSINISIQIREGEERSLTVSTL